MNEAPLLPSNASDLEHDLDASAARVSGVPVPIRDLWDPDKAPAHTLPWLAWALSVDVWDDSWSETKKRVVIERAYSFHRKKGTLAGVRALCDLLETRLAKIDTPPSKTFASPALTEAERAAWLRQFPELRVYHHRVRGTRGTGAGFTMHKTAPSAVKTYPNAGIAGHAFALVSDARRRALPRVFRVEPDDTQRELTTRSIQPATVTRTVVRRKVQDQPPSGAGAVVQFVERTLRGYAALASVPGAGPAGQTFPGGPRAFATDKDARERTYIVEWTDKLHLTTFARSRHTVQPLNLRGTRGTGGRLSDGDPLRARAERVADIGQRRGAFAGACYPDTSAPYDVAVDHYPGSRMYQRSRLFDRNVSVPATGRNYYAGVGRVSLPPYYAYMTIPLERRHPRRDATVNRFPGGFPVANDHQRRDHLIQGLRWTKSKRDKVLLITRVNKPVTVGGGTLVGDHVVGGTQEVT